MTKVYLIGGGWAPRELRATLRPFVCAAGGAAARIACVLVGGWGQRVAFPAYAAALRAAGAAAVAPVFVSPENPLRAGALVGATGLLVGGGAPPAYQRALCPTAGEWLPVLRACGIPYAGYSAGAMIAAEVALLGGWKVRTPTGERRLVARAFGEGLTYLECRPGLGLVPFLVDVHAAQWGTTARLRHAVAAGWGGDGWAIDEGTLVEVCDGTATVHGLGMARRARLHAGLLTVETLGAGAVRRISPPGAARLTGFTSAVAAGMDGRKDEDMGERAPREARHHDESGESRTPHIPHVSHPHLPQVHRARNVNALHDERLTLGQRVADRVAATMGSWRFIITQSCILVAWITLNAIGFARHWDPYPFILLNLALSFQAAYAAPIIMMSQNRQATKDRLHAEEDFRTNVLAEREIATLQARLATLTPERWDALCTAQEAQLALLREIRDALVAADARVAEGNQRAAGPS